LCGEISGPKLNPRSSVRELAPLTWLSKSTVPRPLTESLGFTIRHLHWIPIGFQTIRVNLSREILRVLQRQQARGWHNILTLDESWFYLSTDDERIWLTPEQPVPDRERHMT
jgi:hypothetical protein